MSELVIGLAGRARVGKDTAADYLTSRYGLARLAFATPMKEGLRAMFGLDDRRLHGELKEAPIPELGRSPRQLMQTLGDWGRSNNPRLWIWAAERYLNALKADIRSQGLRWHGVVITDIRTESEADWVRDIGGTVFHLTRRQAPDVAAHNTEHGIHTRLSDFTVPNDGTVEELHHRLADTVGILRSWDPHYMQTFGALADGD